MTSALLEVIAHRVRGEFSDVVESAYLEDQNHLVLFLKQRWDRSPKSVPGSLRIGADGFISMEVAQNYFARSECAYFDNDDRFLDEMYESVDILLKAFMELAAMISGSDELATDRRGYIPVPGGKYIVKFHTKRSKGFISGWTGQG